MNSRKSEFFKSTWRGPIREIFQFYCPLCRSLRRISQAPQPRLRHFIQIGITTAFLMLLSWPWIAWKGVVAYLPLWIGFEMIYRSRIRAAVVCDQCGFDPFLYLVDIKKTRTEVEKHWRDKFEKKGIPYPSASIETKESQSDARK